VTARILARFPYASNVTLLLGEAEDRWVYKPTSGQQPLWDFPEGNLAQREVATFLLAQALGWEVVPPTVLRSDGPLGPGSWQRYVDAQGPPVAGVVPAGEVPPDWCAVASGEDADGAAVVLGHAEMPALRRIALLDLVANNADRKAGHLLVDAAGRVWGIDHGLTFHEEDKLRTVLWGFAGELIEPDDQAALGGLRDGWEGFALSVADLIAPPELLAARDRLGGLLAGGRFPLPAPGWPRLPWPPV